jgi:hypothetical protein
MHRRYTWEKAREKLQHYRRRSPEASVLYQIVYHSRDDLHFQWEARFQHQYGCLRDEVLKTFDEYLNCGILAHGAARVYCDGCKHSLLIAFSCKRRGVCPSCGAKRAVKFAEHKTTRIATPSSPSQNAYGSSLSTTASSTPSSFAPLGERSLRCSELTTTNSPLSSPYKLPARR